MNIYYLTKIQTFILRMEVYLSTLLSEIIPILELISSQLRLYKDWYTFCICVWGYLN